MNGSGATLGFQPQASQGVQEELQQDAAWTPLPPAPGLNSASITAAVSVGIL